MTRSIKRLPTESREKVEARHEWKRKRAEQRKRDLKDKIEEELKEVDDTKKHSNL